MTESHIGPSPHPPPPGPGSAAERLLPGEPLAEGLARVAGHALGVAIDGLECPTDPDEGVHLARKALKRVRAVLRLVRVPLGEPVYRREDTAVRAVGRAVATVRDSRVLVDTLDRVAAGTPGAPSAGEGVACRAELQRQADESRRAVLDDPAEIAALVTALEGVRSRVTAWSTPTPLGRRGDGRVTIADDFTAIAAGLERTYRRGRRAMAGAAARPSGSAFHEWRKQVKYLRHQLEALEYLHPGVIAAQSVALDELGEALGLEHDLTVLIATVETPGVVRGGPGGSLLTRRAAEDRDALRTGALALGARLYREAPGSFTSRIGGYWDIAHGEEGPSSGAEAVPSGW